jgi:hypothetical protein
MNPTLSKRAIRDGVIDMIHEVLVNTTDDELFETCGRTIELLSREPLNRRPMLEQGVVECLSIVSGMDYVLDIVARHTMTADAKRIQDAEEHSSGANRATTGHAKPKKVMLARLALRTLCQLSTGTFAPCKVMVEDAGVELVGALVALLPSFSGQVVKDVAVLLSNASFSASLSELAHDGALRLLSKCMGSTRDASTLQRCAIALYNISTEADNHLTMARQGSEKILVRLAMMPNQSIQTMRFSSMALCSMTMQDAVRNIMVRTGITESLCELHASIKSGKAADELTTKCIALSLSNLSRNAKSQSTIIKHVDIVPLMATASTMSRYDRNSLEVRVKPGNTFNAQGSPDVISSERSDDGLDDSFKRPTISSKMMNLELDSHDFDPARTVPPPPTLPEYAPLEKLLAPPANEGLKIKKKIPTVEEGGAVVHHAQTATTGGGMRRSSVDVRKSRKSAKVAEAEQTEPEEVEKKKRYSEQPYLHGPCVVSNPTLETLAEGMFQRACVTMKDLQNEERNVLRRKDRDANLKRAAARRALQCAREEERAMIESSFLGLGPEHNVVGSFGEQEEEEEESGIISSFPLNDSLARSTPGGPPPQQQQFGDSGFAAEFRESVAKGKRPGTESSVISNVSTTSSMFDIDKLVSTTAMRARNQYRHSRKQQYKSARDFVAAMQDRASNLRMKEDTRLRRVLLEQTYTWASAEQTQGKMQKRGTWQPTGDLVGFEPSIELDSLPRMMVEGLKRVLSSRLYTPAHAVTPSTASTAGSGFSGRLLASRQMKSRSRTTSRRRRGNRTGSRGFSRPGTRGGSPERTPSRLGTERSLDHSPIRIPGSSQGGMEFSRGSTSGTPSRGGTSGALQSRGGTSGTLPSRGSGLPPSRGGMLQSSRGGTAGTLPSRGETAGTLE